MPIDDALDEIEVPYKDRTPQQRIECYRKEKAKIDNEIKKLTHESAKIEYKILEDNNIMLIITNISSQKKLERKVKKEQNILKMIVTIIGDSDIFYDIKKDFEYFIRNTKEYINNKRTSLYNINEL